MASVRVLGRAPGGGMHADWIASTRPRLRRVLGDDALLPALTSAPDGALPPFLVPAARGLDGALDAELAALASTPPEDVEAGLALAGLAGRPEVRGLARDPRSGLQRLAGEIAAYWDIALAGDWPRIRSVLESEVFRGAQTLAERGVGALLNDLHPAIAWDGTALTIAGQSNGRGDATAEELILVPSCFAWPSVVTVASADSHQIAYPAHGAGTLWEPSARHADDLAAVLGRCRALLLASLDAPASTSELARRTGMSIGGTSDNLAALRAAGLVIRRRHGKRVLSARTAVADALVARAPGA